MGLITVTAQSPRAASASRLRATKVPNRGAAALGYSVASERTRFIARSQAAHEHPGDRDPGRIVDHLLLLPRPGRKDRYARALAVDQPAERETPAPAGHQDVAVDRPTGFGRVDLAQPQLVAHAVFARAGFDRQNHPHAVASQLAGEQRVARRG